MTVRDRDRGARRLSRALDDMRDVRVSVGVHEDAGAEPHPSGGGTVAEVAAIVEFGTEDSAPRAPIRGAADSIRGRLESGLARTAERVARGRINLDDGLRQVGAELAADVRRRIPVDTGTTADAVAVRVHLDGAR